MKRAMNSLRSSFMLMVMLTLLLGVAYPLGVFAIAQTLFSHRANGSLIERGGKVMGSSLLGQSFESPDYFWGRLSATTPPYNPSASAGSNLSAGNPKLLESVNARVAALHKADPENKALIPVDLVTASASGLDPHISVASAQYQLHRVAKARGMKSGDVQDLLEKSTEAPGFGLFQAPYVNIIQLNMWLDEATKKSPKEKR